MTKFKLLLILFLFTSIGYSQDILDKNRLLVLDSLICMNDIKGLKENKKELGIYIIRGKKEIDYLVLKCDNGSEYYFLIESIKKYEYLKKLDVEYKLEIIIKQH